MFRYSVIRACGHSIDGRTLVNKGGRKVTSVPSCACSTPQVDWRRHCRHFCTTNQAHASYQFGCYCTGIIIAVNSLHLEASIHRSSIFSVPSFFTTVVPSPSTPHRKLCQYCYSGRPSGITWLGGVVERQPSNQTT